MITVTHRLIVAILIWLTFLPTPAPLAATSAESIHIQHSRFIKNESAIVNATLTEPLMYDLASCSNGKMSGIRDELLISNPLIYAIDSISITDGVTCNTVNKNAVITCRPNSISQPPPISAEITLDIPAQCLPNSDGVYLQIVHWRSHLSCNQKPQLERISAWLQTVPCE